MVLAVQVHPSSSRPHHFRREGPEAGVYVRVGSTNRRADRELIEELRRFARGTSFDEQAMPDLDSEALDFRAASESFASVRRLKRADLDTLRLLTNHQGRSVPTVAGVLLFGKERVRHFPDAWIQAGRFRGTDKARIVDNLEIRTLPVPTDRAILDALVGGAGRSTLQIAGAIGLSSRATRTRLARLVSQGLVREIGTSPQDPKRRYFLAEGGGA